MQDSHLRARPWSAGSSLWRAIPLLGAMLATLAMLGAASASAEPVGLFVAGAASEEAAKQPRFEAEKYTATISGSSTTQPKFGFQWGNFECNSLSLSSKATSATKELALLPTFSFPFCSFFGFATTISLNGCEFVLHANNAGPPYTGNTEIKCPSGSGMTFSAFNSGTLKCTVTVPPQKGLEAVSLENTGAGSGRGITATFNLSKIAYTQTAGTGLAKCTSGEFTNGTFTVTEKLTATK